MSAGLPFILLGLICCLSPALVPAQQWTTNGTSIYNANPGNVGIGTSAPTSKLHVNTPDTSLVTINSSASINAGRSVIQLLRNGNTGWDFGYNLSLSDDAFTIRELAPGFFSYRFYIQKSTGNIGIGTTSPTKKLHVVGDVEVTGNIAAKYQDVAEWVPSTQKLAPGTVVVLDTERSNQVLASTRFYDTCVAGVVSAQPGVILGLAGEGKLMIATTGRVKVKVDATNAPIKVGDLLVTSNVSGMAMKSIPLDFGGVPIHRPGTIIGKALEPLNKGQGEILVLLSLQ